MKDKVAESQQRAKKLKGKLESRKERDAKRQAVDLEALNNNEKSMAIGTANLMTEMDRSREDNSLLAALRAMEEEDARNAQLTALREALKGGLNLLFFCDFVLILFFLEGMK